MTTVSAGSLESANPVSAVQKKYCSRALFTAIALGALLIGLGHISLGKGLILGTLFSIINFILMGRAMSLKVGHARRKAMVIALGSMAGRMLLLALPMVLAIKTEMFHIATTMLGVFAVQIMILTDYIISPIVRGLLGRIAGNSRGV